MMKSWCSTLCLLVLLLSIHFGHAAFVQSTRKGAIVTTVVTVHNVQWWPQVVAASASVRSSRRPDTTGTCGHDDNGDFPVPNNMASNMACNDATAAASQRRRACTMTFLGVLTSPLLLMPFQQERYNASAAMTTDPFYQKAESSTMESGLLDSRVTENVLSPPPYGMEGTDIFYPSWFAGTWNVQSIGTDVQAPCGVALFGGNNILIKARSEIGQVLHYQSRFLPAAAAAGSTDTDGSTCIADREYNVRSIAKAAMGPNSVVDSTLSSPNKISCVLALQGAPSLLRVDLITLKRRQEDEFLGDDGISPRFDCSEVVREIVAPIGNSNNSPQSSLSSQQTASVLKEVETTSLYAYDKVKDEIHCRQRSATFLLPSQQSPMAMKMWEAARGRPVDVRFYDVLYTRPTQS